MTSTMPVEVFSSEESAFAWRVRLALELKGVPYAIREVDLRRGEQHAPAFRAINPRGLVPAIRYGDLVLYESVAILAWLDRAFPEPPLFGATPAEAGLVWRLVAEIEQYFVPAGREVVGALLRGDERLPAEAARAAMEAVHQEQARIDRWLEARRFLAGDRPSAADVALLPLVEALRFATGLPQARALGLDDLPSARALPHLEGWLLRMRALPAFARSAPRPAAAASRAAG